MRYNNKMSSAPAIKSFKRPVKDLTLCIREASRAAHRERDVAAAAYEDRRFDLASNSKLRKENLYSLKERGIIALHREGKLRYIGASPQGMAIYEYGDGGKQCFHSTLHPEDAERIQVEGHPEVLMVGAKEKIRGVSIARVMYSLDQLPYDFSGYSRSASPARSRRLPTCWDCGEEGHISMHCPLNSDDDDDGLYQSPDDDDDDDDDDGCLYQSPD